MRQKKIGKECFSVYKDIAGNVQIELYCVSAVYNKTNGDECNIAFSTGV